MQAVGERPQQALLVRIMLVLGVRQRACRRDDWKECARDLGFGGGGLEVGDVAFDLNVGVGQRRVDHEARAEPLAQSGNPVVFGVELGERDAVLTASDGRHGILGFVLGERPGGNAGQPVMDVKGPVAAFAELAVADDIDTGVRLLPDHLLDRFLEAGFVRDLVVGLAILDLAQELDQLGRSYQAADMRGEDAVAGHVSPRIFSSLPGRFHITSGLPPQPSSAGGSDGVEQASGTREPFSSPPHRSCRSAFSRDRYCRGTGSAAPPSMLRSAPPASVSALPPEAPCWRSPPGSPP